MRARAARTMLTLGIVALATGVSRSQESGPPRDSKEDARVRVDAAIRDGIAALASSQAADGHLGESYPIAVTSMAGLAILAGEDEPLGNPALLRAHAWLRSKQKGGAWPAEGHTWVHVQGFATLFFAELYGRVLATSNAPAQLSKDELRETVTKAVALIADAQSESGGWYYTKTPSADEGSTTVCAVQALRAARNFGIPVEQKVLDRGFSYLKTMQNQDGGFRYARGSGGSMVAGTAGALATLVLMSKLDERVLVRAVGFLKERRVEGIGCASHRQYGLFYAAMAMKVIAFEYGEHMPEAGSWSREIESLVASRQGKDGSWASADVEQMKPDYGTALSVLTLSCSRGRLSVFNKRAPKNSG
ncbi:terpene cyclase/mutase family protein [bacterium]|nr:terpene cyclase/mutase family protein [bacterium]